MKGLLTKDIAIFMQRKRAIVFLAIWVITMAFLMDDLSFTIGWSTIIASFFAISSMAYDEYDNTLPFLRITENGENVGGIVLSFNNDGDRGDLDLLFVNPDAHSRGIGFSAWQQVEKMYPDIKVWETCTPYFETRNIHFYVNKCKFKITEFYNIKHPDPNEPVEENESGANTGMFRFEKVMGE